MHSPDSSGRLRGMHCMPLETKSPDELVPPVPRTDPGGHGGSAGNRGLVATPIRMHMLGVGRGWPPPGTQSSPGSTPPITGGMGPVGVAVTVEVAGRLAVAVVVTDGVLVTVRVRVGVNVVVPVAVAVAVRV